jgi:hypothetical protein
MEVDVKDEGETAYRLHRRFDRWVASWATPGWSACSART